MSMTLTAFRNLYGASLTFLGTSLIFTLFLYYIDEGRYSLEGLLTLGNIVAMSIYFLGSFTGQWLLFYTLTPNSNFRKGLSWSIPGGLVLGVFISIGIIYTIKLSWQLAQ